MLRALQIFVVAASLLAGGLARAQECVDCWTSKCPQMKPYVKACQAAQPPAKPAGKPPAKPADKPAAEPPPPPTAAAVAALAAGGGVRQIQQVHATGYAEYDAPTFTALPGTSTVVTTAGGKVLLLANIDSQTGNCQNGDAWATFTIRRNGQSLSPTEWGLAVSVTTAARNTMTPMMWLDAPPAGTYTYDLAIRYGAGNCKYGIQEHAPSVLIVAELKP